MADRPEDAIQAILTGILNMQQLSLANRLAVEGLLEGEPQGEWDQLGRTRKEARAEYLAFTRDQLTFERGQDRWGDFAVRFRGAARDYGVTEEQAKRVLYDAITGSSSRLLITSLSLELPAGQEMNLEITCRGWEKSSCQWPRAFRWRRNIGTGSRESWWMCKTTSTPNRNCSFWRSQMPKLETEWNSIGKRRRDS